MADPLFTDKDLKIMTTDQVQTEPEDLDEGFTVEELALEFAKAAIASGAYNTEAGVNFEAAIVQAWTNGIIGWKNGQDAAAKLFGLPTATDFTP